MKLRCLYWLAVSILIFPAPLSAQADPESVPPASADFWLRQVNPSADIPGLSYELVADKSSLTARHLSWQPMFQGKPVFGPLLRAHILPTGRLLQKHTPLPSTLQTPSTRALWARDTAELASSFRNMPSAYTSRAQAGWQLTGNQLQAVFRVEAYHWDAIHAREYILDAQRLDTLSFRDMGVYHHAPLDTPGTGRIFWPDPCTKGSVTYGTLFIDSMDYHYPVFDSLMDTVILRDLTYKDSTFQLEGPYVSVQDLAPFSDTVANSPDGTFFYDRSDSRFEDVMVYFHIDTFQRYVQRLGFTNLQNSPLRVDPHGLGNSDQSSFIPNNGNPYLLFGDGGVDDAEDADVIIHEYIHALSESASGSNNGLERRGLDEGLADYFAAGYSYDLSLWNWYELYNWDGHNEFWSGRMAVTIESYPPSSSGIYSFGQLYASTLMEIRQEMGAEEADKLVLESMYYNFENMRLTDGAEILLKVDSLLYNGIHLDLLRDKLCGKGLLSGAECLSVSNIPLEPSEAAFQAAVTKASIRLLEIPRDFRTAGSELQLWDLQGRILQRWSLTNENRQFSLAFPPSPGLYLLRVVNAENGQLSQSVMIHP